MNPNSHRLLIGFTCCCIVLASAWLHPRASRGPAAPDRQEATRKEFLATRESHFSVPRPPGRPLALSHDSTKTFGKLPVYFEPNRGQTDRQVKFIARGSGATTFLTATDIVLALPLIRHSRERGNPATLTALAHQDIIGRSAVGLGRISPGFGPAVFETSQLSPEFESPQSAIANRQSPIPMQSAITMRLVGANLNAQIEGVDRLPGISNYFIGNDPSEWRTNIAHYLKVRYRDVYPGIDLVYYGKEQQLEFDFIVSPGGNPDSIQLAFEGIESPRLSPEGDIIVSASGHEIRQRKPRIYQVVGGVKNEGRYR